MNEYDRMAAALGVSGGGMYGAVGLDQIVGALEQIVGADAAASIAQLAQLKAAGGVGVAPVVRDKHRIQPSPFASTVLTAAQQTTISIQPQRLIQILSLLIPSALGTLFDVRDIKVGQQTQYITTGVIPAQLFSEVADGNRSRVKFDSADVGNTVALDLTNNDAVNSQTFKATLIATSVYG